VCRTNKKLPMPMNKIISFDGNKDLRILIIKPSSLGDILHTFPAVSVIAERYPEARIDWLVNPAFASILKYHPDVENVIHFPRGELAAAKTFFPAFFSLCSKLRKNKYDIVIDFQGLFRSSFFAAVSGAAVRAGFAEPREKFSRFFYNFKMELPDSHIHAIEKNVFLACALTGLPFMVPETALAVNEKCRRSLSDIMRGTNIEDSDICVGIAPGARWESKRWPPEFFAEIIRQSSAKFPSVKFLLIGSGEDRETAEKILKLCGCGKEQVISLAGRTGICELTELLRRCSVILTNDSGPMHIAAALHVPVLALFGPTAPEKTGPYWREHRIFQAETDCIKCMKRYCSAGRVYDCHDKIKASELSECIGEFLTKGMKYEQI